MEETTRQQLARWLTTGEYDFEELRLALELPARVLEEELRHVERSLRRRGRRLRVAAAECRDCGFGFRGREARHLRPPGRCPRCRGEHIAPPRFRASDPS